MAPWMFLLPAQMARGSASSMRRNLCDLRTLLPRECIDGGRSWRRDEAPLGGHCTERGRARTAGRTGWGVRCRSPMVDRRATSSSRSFGVRVPRLVRHGGCDRVHAATASDAVPHACWGEPHGQSARTWPWLSICCERRLRAPARVCACSSVSGQVCGALFERVCQCPTQETSAMRRSHSTCEIRPGSRMCNVGVRSRSCCEFDYMYTRIRSLSLLSELQLRTLGPTSD
mmetsp:Transcript_46070/g.120695  ORF Transcript_46070/g.120695 Transcript_46070/m.120695 type:complete len:229 (-) Transcript_46070:2046-2732(-)